MDPDEKNKIEEKINKVYSKIGGRRNKFATDVDLEYQSMVEALSAFMPIEIKASEFDTLCNVLGGIPSVLLNAKDASTYNNIKELSKIFYINTLIPILTDVYSSISRGLGINKESIWIEPDTSKIEALSPDVIKQIETKKTETEYYVYLFEKGLMTEGELKNKIKL
jgi:phage portal protein BeeE